MKVALGIEYDGAELYGWQRQQNVASVQQYLEQALSRVADSDIIVHCAGRTDAGVHATGQVVHFESPNPRPERAWTLGVNANLPNCVAVTWAKPVSQHFHARFSATARRYRYIIYNHQQRPAILGKGVTHVHRQLNHERMHTAAQVLVGEHDFSSFRAALCQSTSPFRNVMHIVVSRQGRYIVIDIKANAFVHHMVRNIAGSLIAIGSGEQEIDWMQWLLGKKDRTLAAATAKPHGLYLVSVDYPDSYQLPTHPLGPLFLAEN